MTGRPRYPLARYPTGWFQIAYSDELAPGEVKPVEYFGQHLVLFRTEAGVAHLLDAYCPHLGAHLGHGGKVEGDCVRCPFHAWKFDGAGQCKEIPYAKKIPPKATIATWHVRERNQQILAWHDIDGGPPTWEVPELSELGHPDWSEPVRREWKIKAHSQEMAENAVDRAHFRYLHGTHDMPETRLEWKEHLMHMVSDTRMKTPAGIVSGTIEAHSYGFGFSTNRFTGIVETFLIAGMAPIDDDYIHVRFAFLVKKMGGADVTEGVGRAFVAEISRQLEQDIPIWENKVLIEPPLLCDGDGPVGPFRKWCRQFFPAWYREQARAAFENQ